MTLLYVLVIVLYISQIIIPMIIFLKIQKINEKYRLRNIIEIKSSQSSELVLDELIKKSKENARADGLIHLHDLEVLAGRIKKQLIGKD